MYKIVLYYFLFACVFLLPIEQKNCDDFFPEYNKYIPVLMGTTGG